MKLKTILPLSLLLLVTAFTASLALGARWVPITDVFDVVMNQNTSTMNARVVLERIPRTVFGIIAGAALGVSGTLMQAITRNPIADPSILGVNTGASLFVVSGIAFFNIGTANAFILFALMGAVLTSVFVFGIGAMGSGGATPIKLALAGAATSAALSSIVSAIMLPRTEVMNAFRFWQVGSISGATWEGITAIIPLITIGLIVAFIYAPSFDALSLGDDVATGLGVRTGHVRLIGAIAGILLCGATTALAGPIGFVGLMVPHALRMLLGPNLKVIIPFSALFGATLLLFSDVIGRLLGGVGELEVGVVTAFIGAPILILIAMRAKGRAL